MFSQIHLKDSEMRESPLRDAADEFYDFIVEFIQKEEWNDIVEEYLEGFYESEVDSFVELLNTSAVSDSVEALERLWLPFGHIPSLYLINRVHSINPDKGIALLHELEEFIEVRHNQS